MARDTGDTYDWGAGTGAGSSGGMSGMGGFGVGGFGQYNGGGVAKSAGDYNGFMPGNQGYTDTNSFLRDNQLGQYSGSNNGFLSGNLSFTDAGNFPGSGALAQGANQAGHILAQGYDQSTGQYINPGRDATQWSNTAASAALGGQGSQAQGDYWNGFMQFGPLQAAMQRAGQMAGHQANAMGLSNSGAGDYNRQSIMAQMGYGATQDQIRNLLAQQGINQNYNQLGANTTNMFATNGAQLAYGYGQQVVNAGLQQQAIQAAQAAAQAQANASQTSAGIGLIGSLVGGLLSDRNAKDHIGVAPGLSFIMQLKPVAYSYKDDPDRRARLGFYAQEVEAVGEPTFGGVERPARDGDIYRLNYAEMIAPLVKALQELKTEFDAYKATHEPTGTADVRADEPVLAGRAPEGDPGQGRGVEDAARRGAARPRELPHVPPAGAERGGSASAGGRRLQRRHRRLRQSAVRHSGADASAERPQQPV